MQNWQEHIAKAIGNLEEEQATIGNAIHTLRTLGNLPGPKFLAWKKRAAFKPRTGPALAKRKAAGFGKKHARKNAPRGLLSSKLHEVLGKSAKPMMPGALCNAVIKAGYPVKNPRTLYTQIFAAAKKDPRISKTQTGFALRKRA